MNGTNELTSAVELACLYDANGNLTNRVYDATGPKTYNYFYDDENLLIELRTDTSATPTASRWRTTWLYDGLGRARVRKEYYWSGTWTQNGETRYIYDGMRVIQERDSSNTPTVAYTRGNDLSGSLEGADGIGGLLGRSHGYSSGTWSTHNHYHADGNGNVTFLVNSGQTAEAWYRFDPYGRTMAQSATALTTENLYRFSSKEIHAQSGMYYYGFRFYDPNLQRWPNRDPRGERDGFEGINGIRVPKASEVLNLFIFVANNPLNAIDPFGLKEKKWKELLDVWEETIEKGLPGGEFCAALRVFNGCSTIGMQPSCITIGNTTIVWPTQSWGIQVRTRLPRKNARENGIIRQWESLRSFTTRIARGTEK